MNILEQNKEKINGKLETFDRMIINGYLLNLQNYRHFLYYLIQNNVKLKDFDKFASEQTEELCKHIDSYIKENNRVVRKLKMWYNLSAGYERRKLESSLYGVTLIHI